MTGTEIDLAQAAEEAWLYALPLIEFAWTRQRSLGLGAKLNRFVAMANLADHNSRIVTTPNNDTLYSTGQIDLSGGPVTLVIPPSGERYLSVALMDAYTNNTAVLGTRTVGPEGGRFRLVGPAEAGSDADTVRLPTNQVWALARIMVDDEEDLPAARAVQAGITLDGPALDDASPRADRKADWRDYFAVADRLMALNPPPATDRRLLRLIAPLRLGTGNFDASAFSNQEQEAIAQGVERARASVRRVEGGARGIRGWYYPPQGLGNFGQAYRFRAQIALGALAALPPEEAMYMRALGPDKGLFDGNRAWRLHFPAGQTPPVDAFWSLTLYEPTEDGQFFFTDNPIRRYAIGSRTKNLRHAADGALDLWIGHDRPEDDKASNWLPAPAGPFALFMRAYLPQLALQSGSYRLPEVVLA